MKEIYKTVAIKIPSLNIQSISFLNRKQCRALEHGNPRFQISDEVCMSNLSIVAKERTEDGWAVLLEPVRETEN